METIIISIHTIVLKLLGFLLSMVRNILESVHLYSMLRTDAKKTAHSNYFVILIHFFIVLLLDMVKYLKIVWVEDKLSKKTDKN